MREGEDVFWRGKDELKESSFGISNAEPEENCWFTYKTQVKEATLGPQNRSGLLKQY